jgi:hypothetical protein
MKQKASIICFSAAILISAFVIVILHRQAAHLRINIRELAQENKSLAADLNRTANQLSNVIAEHKRLSLERTDIPRLRGEVTRLRKQLRDLVQNPRNVERAQAEFQRNYKT